MIPISQGMPEKWLLNIDGKSFDASFSPTKNCDSKLDLHLTLMGFDLINDINAGEFHGRKLAHNLVKLGNAVVTSRNKIWQGQLPKIPEHLQDYK
jgi:hypothetical protein